MLKKNKFLILQQLATYEIIKKHPQKGTPRIGKNFTKDIKHNEIRGWEKVVLKISLLEQTIDDVKSKIMILTEVNSKNTTCKRTLANMDTFTLQETKDYKVLN